MEKENDFFREDMLLAPGGGHQERQLTPVQERQLTQVVEDIEHIYVSSVLGPLVILYGPPSVGKTVTLFRLCSFLSSTHPVRTNRSFRVDASYNRSVDEFERQREQQVLAPDATAAINFLLLDITRRAEMYCQILEAPGEHFFSLEKHAGSQFPYYLNQIFQGSFKKVYIIFFDPQILADQSVASAYANSIVGAMSRHINSKRDRVIVVYNKCDERPDLLRNGLPVEREFRRLVYSNHAVGPLTKFLEESRFGRVHFVPFSSGQFGVDRQGKKTYSMSEDHYPRRLWNAIDDCVKGSWWPWSK